VDSRDTHSFGFESFGIKATLTTFEDIWKTISVAVKTRQDLSHHQTPSANIGDGHPVIGVNLHITRIPRRGWMTMIHIIPYIMF